MEKLSNTEAELKKSLAYKKVCSYLRNLLHQINQKYWKVSFRPILIFFFIFVLISVSPAQFCLYLNLQYNRLNYGNQNFY